MPSALQGNSSDTLTLLKGNFSQGNEMGFYDAEQEQASLLDPQQLIERIEHSDVWVGPPK